MNFSQQSNRTKRAVQWVFFACGLAFGSWAPMVPYVKDGLDLNEAELGVLMLFLGGGALLMMPLAGWLIRRFGSRVVIAGAACVVALALPSLLLVTRPSLMAIALLVFGAGIGAVDVAMNAHGVQLQNLSGRAIMSSLHGLFSIGGLAGSLGLGFLVKLGLDPVSAAIGLAVFLIVIVLNQYRHLFDFSTEREGNERIASMKDATDSRGGSWLNGSVLFLGFLCFAAFLSEGAMLDWSAVFLRDVKQVSPEMSGTGFAAFSIAMAGMRMLGDRLVERWSRKILVVGGCALGAIGIVIAIASPWTPLVLGGFVLLGLGAANVVPVLFSEGGRLKGISPAVAIPVITTIGYAGQLAGPALLGFIAHDVSLDAAFGFAAFMLSAIAVSYALRKPA